MTAELLILSHKMLGHFAVVLIGAGVFAAVDFSHTITLGSVLVAIVGVIVAVIFTARSKIASVWRQEAEGERAAKERCHEELKEERANRATFDKQQQELRHDLKDEAAGLRAQLKVMEAKTDLTAALRAIQEMNEASVRAITGAVSDAFVEKSKHEHAETHRLLKEISSKLPSEPIDIALHEPINPET